MRKSKAEKAAALAEKAAADLARAQWFRCTSELIVRDRMGNAVLTGGSDVTCGFLDGGLPGAGAQSEPPVRAALPIRSRTMGSDGQPAPAPMVPKGGVFQTPKGPYNTSQVHAL